MTTIGAWLSKLQYMIKYYELLKLTFKEQHSIMQENAHDIILEG